MIELAFWLGFSILPLILLGNSPRAQKLLLHYLICTTIPFTYLRLLLKGLLK